MNVLTLTVKQETLQEVKGPEGFSSSVVAPAAPPTDAPAAPTGPPTAPAGPPTDAPTAPMLGKERKISRTFMSVSILRGNCVCYLNIWSRD